MPKDAPDWTTWVQTTIVVDGEPVPEQPGQETAILATEGKVADATETYKTLATWTVTTAKAGVLRSLEIAASDYELSRFRVTIAGVVKFEDVELPDALTAYMADIRLVADTVVLIEGKSSTGTSVDMWGVIEGKEVA